MAEIAAVSCLPLTEGTVTIGMFGPSLTTRLTAEFFDTDAPAAGLVDRTIPLVCELVRKLVVPTVRLSFFSVWTATLCGSPTTLGTVTLPPNTPTERSRKKAITPSATSSTTRRTMRRRVLFLRSSSSLSGGGPPASAGMAMVRRRQRARPGSPRPFP